MKIIFFFVKYMRIIYFFLWPTLLLRGVLINQSTLLNNINKQTILYYLIIHQNIYIYI